MIFSIAPINLAPMGRKEGGTEPRNFRLSRTLIAEVESFIEHATPIRPTFTQVVESALREWLDKYKSPAGKPAPPRPNR